MTRSARLCLIASLLTASAALNGCGCETAAFGNPARQTIYPIAGMKQDSIFNKSRLWFAETYNSSKHVLDYEDPGEGILVAKAVASYPRAMDQLDVIHYTMKVEAKDERVRVTFSDIRRSANVVNTYYDNLAICECDTMAIGMNLSGLGLSLRSFLLAKPAVRDSW